MKLITTWTPPHTDAARIGGKAATLLRLRAAGLPVPALAVLPAAETADAMADPTAIAAQFAALQQLPAGAARTEAAAALAETVQRSIREEWLAALHQAVTAALPGVISVRSSATSEDGFGAAFAGQYHSVLNVTAAAFAAAVRDCLAAQFAAGVVDYAALHGQRLEAWHLSLIFQAMVPADRAGVFFTQNPRGPLSECVITIGAGTGDHVVTGGAPTTTVHLNPNGTFYTTQQAGAPALRAADRTALSMLAERVQAVLKQDALDLEFAVQGRARWVLQVRPITTIGAGPKTVLSNANLVESYPGLTLPLTIDFVRAAYSGIMQALATRISGSPHAVAGAADLFDGMTVAVNGRLYYQLNNWYTLLNLIPAHRLVIPIWEDMMGMPQVAVNRRPLRLGWARLTTGPRLLAAFVNAPRAMETLEADFAGLVAQFNETIARAYTVADLLALYDTLMATVLPKWDVTLVNDLYAFVFTGLLKRRGRATTALAQIGNLESMRPVRALRALAAQIRAADATATILGLSTRAAVTGYLAQNTPIAQAMQAYIDAFGDRTAGELKLETPTLRVAPERLVAMLQPYLRNDVSGAGETSASAEPTDDPGTDSPTRPARGMVGRAMLGIANRERSRLNRSRLYGMARTIMRRIGARLVALGALDQTEDVFYLRLAELRAVAAAGGAGALGDDLRARVALRRTQYDAYAQLPDPGLMIFAGAAHDAPLGDLAPAPATAAAPSAPAVLHGTPTADGVVTGTVVHVQDPATVGDVRGKILVTTTTDPGWVFLMAQAAGIIAEQGSLLSHTAIIARELGVPAVVGVTGATRRLTTGMRVKLDAQTGTIEEVQP